MELPEVLTVLEYLCRALSRGTSTVPLLTIAKLRPNVSMENELVGYVFLGRQDFD